MGKFQNNKIGKMDADKRIELTIKILTSVITLATVIIGIWQFNKGQAELKDREITQRKFELTKMNNQATIETLTKFKEMQNKLYGEAIEVVGYLTVHTDYESPKYKETLDRFWQLYWVGLSTVETPEVEQKMKDFGDLLKETKAVNLLTTEQQQTRLTNAGYYVAQAIKKSSRTWLLPESLQEETAVK